MIKKGVVKSEFLDFDIKSSFRDVEKYISTKGSWESFSILLTYKTDVFDKNKNF